MGKVHYRCLKEQTEIVIPAQCIDTFCIGKNFPLDQTKGDVSIQVKEGAVVIKPSHTKAVHGGEILGMYTRDEDSIQVFLPAHICRIAFNAEEEGELRIEVIDDQVLASKL
ncbi:MAG: hypothetical protein ACXV44_01055 [Halobacteriota archaeon]